MQTTTADRPDSRKTRSRLIGTRFPVWFAVTEGVRSAFSSIRAHSFRSFLTTLGIVIGVASVIGMVSIIQGLSFAIFQELEGLGSNSVTVQSFTPLRERLQRRFSRLTQRDLDLISYRIDGIESITPIMYSRNGQSQIRYGSQTAIAQVLGTTYSFQEAGQYFSQYGRFLSDWPTSSRQHRRSKRVTSC